MRSRAFSLLFIALCVSCANRAVVKGALTPEERKQYVDQTGTLIPQRLKGPFLAGKAAEGMTREMVVFIYGKPNRTEDNRYGIGWGSLDGAAPSVVDTRDSIWNYFASDSVSVRRGMIFRADTLAQIIEDSTR